MYNDERFLEKKDNIWLKAIGIYQIASSVLFAVIIGLAAINLKAAMPWWYLLSSLFLFSLTLYAGWAIYRRKAFGVNLTSINQLLQLFVFFFGSVQYAYFSGLGVVAKVFYSGTINLKIEANLSSLSLGVFEEEVYGVGINLVALIIFVKIEGIKSTYTKRKKLYEA